MNKTSPSAFQLGNRLSINKVNIQSSQSIKMGLNSCVKFIGYFPPIKKSTQQYSQTLKWDNHIKSYLPLAKKQINKYSNNIFIDNTHSNGSMNTNNSNSIHINSNSNVKNSNINSNVVNPIRILSQSNTIGLIDQNSNAWILNQIFQYPINLSLLLKKKVKQMYLNQKQAILLTTKGLILINWGAKRLFQKDALIKIPTYDTKSLYENFFQAFNILDTTSFDKFYMTNLKKIQNSNKMYRITDNDKNIIAYPTMQKFKFQTKIIGISVGKFHALCWDQHGQLFSWGTRSLGLGLDNLPDDDIVSQPTKVNLKFKVKSAFASNHYSLALCPDGILYQWGIKKQVNQLNQQLIFSPRKFQFKYFKYINKRFTCLKGRNDKFGILSFSGDLYVWGQKTRSFVNPNSNIPKQWQNNRLYQPYLVRQPQNQKIIDFAIQQNFLSIITINKQANYKMKQQVEYWNHTINSIRNKFDLKKYKRLNTQVSMRRRSTMRRQSSGELRNNLNVYVQNKNKISMMMLKNKENNNNATMISTFSQNNNQDNNLRFNFNKKAIQTQRIKTQGNQITQLLQYPTSRDDNISRAFYDKKSKQQYIQMSKRQQRLFNYILSPTHHQNTLSNNQHQLSKRKYKQSHAMMSVRQKMQKRLKSQGCQSDNNNNKKKMKFINMNNFAQMPDFLKEIQEEIKHKKDNSKSINIKLMNNTVINFNHKKKDTKTYHQRLKQVLQKKRHIQTENYNQTLKKLQENSLEFRMKRHMKIQMEKQRQKNQQLLKNTLCKFLIKNYLVKMVTAPLLLGRNIKIQNFARNLKLQRIQKNIRKIFTKAKVRFGLKKLKTHNFSRYALLIMQWRKYVKRFRLKKFQLKRKLIVEEIVKHFTKEKIKLGVYSLNLNIRKLQKLKEWLVMVKNQRTKCLKLLWKVHLFSVMKIAPQSQGIVVCHLPKNVSQITFQTLYSQKVQQNPNLKLANFLNNTPLFRVKMQFFSKLFADGKKPIVKSQKIINYLQKTNKRSKIKFLDQQQPQQKQKQREFKVNLLSNDIYPYSLHYNIFIKPKNYDLSLAEQMKNNEKWIKQQKQILEKKLMKVIIKHQKNLRIKRRQYDLQLAHFIRSKYDVFCQKRWKYIIEYNQIQKTYNKVKRQKQLMRLMDLIGMRKLIEQDCLPEKQAILDQALKRKDAPKCPNNFIVFGQKQFKQVFKIYFDQIYDRYKQIRKIQL